MAAGLAFRVSLLPLLAWLACVRASSGLSEVARLLACLALSARRPLLILSCMANTDSTALALPRGHHPIAVHPAGEDRQWKQKLRLLWEYAECTHGVDQVACRCHARAYRNTTQSNNNNNSLQQWRHIEHNMPYLCSQRGTNEKALLGRESKVHSLSWQPKAATPATATTTATTTTASHFDYINAKHTHTQTHTGRQTGELTITLWWLSNPSSACLCSRWAAYLPHQKQTWQAYSTAVSASLSVIVCVSMCVRRLCVEWTSEASVERTRAKQIPENAAPKCTRREICVHVVRESRDEYI